MLDSVKHVEPAGRRPEINISKFTVGGGVAGLIVVVSILGIALLGLPPARWFLAGSVLVGAIVALVLRALR
jgi:hypothetical protein